RLRSGRRSLRLGRWGGRGDAVRPDRDDARSARGGRADRGIVLSPQSSVLSLQFSARMAEGCGLETVGRLSILEQRAEEPDAARDADDVEDADEEEVVQGGGQIDFASARAGREDLARRSDT